MEFDHAQLLYAPDILTYRRNWFPVRKHGMFSRKERTEPIQPKLRLRLVRRDGGTMIERCYNVADLRRAARARAHRLVFDYVDGGADDETAMGNNHRRFEAYELAYHVLSGVEKPDLSTTLLGHKLDVPFILAPSAGNRLFHKDGEHAASNGFRSMSGKTVRWCAKCCNARGRRAIRR